MMYDKIFRSKYLFVFIFLSVCSLSFAHPHVFIDYESSFIFEKGALVEIDIKWYFDMYFSVSTIENFDINANGKLDPDEVEAFKKITYDGIGEYNFFINLTINGEPVYIYDIVDFKIKMPKQDLVIYEFTIPCENTPIKDVTSVNLYFEDPTYYVAISTSQKDVIIKNDNSVKIINCEIIDEYEHKIEFSKK